MKINPKQYITAQTPGNKTSLSQPKVAKQSFSTDKVELSERAQEHLTLRQAKTEVLTRLDRQFSTTRLHELKMQVQNNDFTVDHDAIATAMLGTIDLVKGK